MTASSLVSSGSGDEPECHECGRDVDPSYTLSFADIGEPDVHFCDVCGPWAHRVQAALEKALKEDPTFAKKLEEAMDRAVAGESH